MSENILAVMNRGIELAAPNLIDVENRQYSDKKLSPIFEPTPEPLVLHSLLSLIEYAELERPEEPIVHVISPLEVRLLSALRGPFMQRDVYAVAKCKPPKFDFGRFVEHEEFMISLQALFEETPDRETVLAVVGNIADERVATFADDGVSQQVTVKSGITRKSEAKVPNPVKLAPYRTFAEIAQPVSPFILRMKQGSPLPSVARFEADGGMWELEAISTIKKFLADKMGQDFTIIG